MADIYKYRIWCNTESTWVTGWYKEEPTVCPNNNTHSIDTDKTSITDIIEDPGPKDRSGKTRVHETSRALGTKTYFTGAGDDPDNPTDIGNGTSFTIGHEVGVDSTNQSIYLDFNSIENETWVHEGYLIWKDAMFDKITLEVVPKITQYHIDSTAATNYELYGGYMIVPPQTVGKGGNEGTVVVDSDITSGVNGLIQMPDNDLGEPPTAFWNADWHSTNKVFENITPAPYGNGRFNIFTVEVVLARFANRIPLLASGFQRMQTADCDELGHGMRFKLSAETNLPDHSWWISFMLTFHREKTA